MVKPGGQFKSVEKGVHNILVWRGKGTFGGYEVEGLNFGHDELLISHDAATQPILVENTGDTRPDHLQVLRAGHQSGCAEDHAVREVGWKGLGIRYWVLVIWGQIADLGERPPIPNP